MSVDPTVPCTGPSDIDSISSFSSLGSEKNPAEISFKIKFEEEKKKCEKLEDRIAGYRTVANQLPKCQETILDLMKKGEENDVVIKELTQVHSEQQKEIEELRQQLLHRSFSENSPRQEILRPSQGHNRGMSDLNDKETRRSSPATPHSSESFVVLGHSSTSSSVKNELMKNDHTPPGSSPTRGLKAVEQSETLGQVNLSQQLQQHQQLQQLQQQQTSSYQTHTGTTISNTVTGSQNSTQRFGGNGTSTQLVRGLSTSAASQNQQSFNIVEDRRTLSYPTAVGGPLGVIAFPKGGLASVRGMDPNPTKPAGPSQMVAGVGDGNFLPSSSTPAAVVSQSDIFAPPSLRPGASSAFVPMPVENYGIGARPKEWKPLNTKQTLPGVGLTDLTPQGGTEVRKTIDLEQIEVNVPPATSDFEFVPAFGKTLAAMRTSGSNMNDLNGTEKLSIGTFEITPLVDVPSQGDLIKFPGEVQQHHGVINPLYSQQSNGVTCPSDEQSQLASQAQNMATTILKTNNTPSGMSEKLFQFAEDAAKMEGKLNEYQALIQRQQVQIQSSATHPQNQELLQLREENKAVREENEMLHGFIKANKEGRGLARILSEPGHVTVVSTEKQKMEPIRTQQSDSPLLKKVESLENINSKLFQANKDWHNKWEVLRQNHQLQKEDLESQVTSQQAENVKLRAELATIEKQLQEAQISKQEFSQRAFDLENERLKLQRDTENLRTELDKLTRDNRRLETEVTALKNSNSLKTRDQTGNKELETEISLLKQQLTVFAEDFQKERDDRTAAESKVDKARKDRDYIKQSLEAKMKKILVQMRTQEDELRLKARGNADLQYQVDELKVKLQREQRKAAQHMMSTYHGGPSSRNFFHNLPSSHVSQQTSGGTSRQVSPEHCAGAWKCQDCTYINYPDRTVCDICGFQNTANGESITMTQEPVSGRPELQSRGEETQGPGTDVPDVETDTC